MSRIRPRVMVVGLDGAPPELVFDRFATDLPVLTALREDGVFGELKSTFPPITIPAWAAMVSGLDPGELGCYGFQNRRDHSYEGFRLPDSSLLAGRALWDHLSAAGLTSVVIGVPPGYPAPLLRGCSISCFMTPGKGGRWLHPPAWAPEIDGVAGGYLFDVEEFRRLAPDRLVAQVQEMTARRFRVARHLAAKVEWDFFMLVEIGVDRIQHGLWHHMDEAHVLHVRDSPFRDAIREYYRFIDAQVGELIAPYREEAQVLVVSDHGAQAMEGGFRLNEWLRRQGYLVLREATPTGVSLRPSMVDWERTRAWGAGGYCGRVFFNVYGREPSGCVAPEAVEALRVELAGRLQSLGTPDGKPVPVAVYSPRDIYSECRGIPPDLMISVGGLRWRCLGGVGPGELWTAGNDQGPDGANHSQHGIFIAAGPTGAVRRGKRLEATDILDVAPTVLAYLGQPLPPQLRGRPVRLN